MPTGEVEICGADFVETASTLTDPDTFSPEEADMKKEAFVIEQQFNKELKCTRGWFLRGNHSDT